jgi:hypothetical protein
LTSAKAGRCVRLHRPVDLIDRRVDCRGGAAAGRCDRGGPLLMIGGGRARRYGREFRLLVVVQRLLEILQRLADDRDGHGQFLDLRLHKPQPRDGLDGNIRRAGFCQKARRRAERAAELLQRLFLIRVRRHFGADARHDRIGIDRRLTQSPVFARRQSCKRGREDPLIIERPRRRIVWEKHILEDRRQSEIRIEQGRRHAAGGFGRRGVVPAGPHIERMMVIPEVREMERYADVKWAYS